MLTISRLFWRTGECELIFEKIKKKTGFSSVDFGFCGANVPMMRGVKFGGVIVLLD